MLLSLNTTKIYIPHACGTNDMEECLSGVEPRVTMEMNNLLLIEFTVVEVETTLGQMQPLKSPGQTALLWDSIKDHVSR